MQAIKRTFTLLTTIATEPEGIGVTDLALRVGLPKGTVSRFLSSLEAEKAVSRTADNRFVLGQQILEWGQKPTTIYDRMVVQAHAALKALNQQTGEAVALSVLSGRHTKYIIHFASSHQVQVVDWTGESIPWHVTSAGKLLMAYAEPTFITQILETPLEPYSPHTQTDPQQLIQAFTQIRETAVAWTNEEFSEGVMGVAMPIFAHHADQQPLAAVTIYGPKYRLAQKETITTTVHHLSQCVQQIQQRLAHS